MPVSVDEAMEFKDYRNCTHACNTNGYSNSQILLELHKCAPWNHGSFKVASRFTALLASYHTETTAPYEWRSEHLEVILEKCLPKNAFLYWLVPWLPLSANLSTLGYLLWRDIWWVCLWNSTSFCWRFRRFNVCCCMCAWSIFEFILQSLH